MGPLNLVATPRFRNRMQLGLEDTMNTQRNERGLCKLQHAERSTLPCIYVLMLVFGATQPDEMLANKQTFLAFGTGEIMAFETP